ncbi:hypothetical protein BN1221_03057 [Brenneria goodwinii]|uniref:Uncharacterized protein n=1 Tax=Brenneria goodwinii TaxID=1109412 RepID=A0A0G4JY31_9GAMM|nr:hypothetical protein BN1221_03057 [Brenneria goodwinii]
MLSQYAPYLSIRFSTFSDIAGSLAEISWRDEEIGCREKKGNWGEIDRYSNKMIIYHYVT